MPPALMTKRPFVRITLPHSEKRGKNPLPAERAVEETERSARPTLATFHF